MTVEELLDRMSSEEIGEWEAFDAVEPIGDLRRDIQAGIIASTLINVRVKNESDAVSPMQFVIFGAEADEKREKAAAAALKRKARGEMTAVERKVLSGLEAAILRADERKQQEPVP